MQIKKINTIDQLIVTRPIGQAESLIKKLSAINNSITSNSTTKNNPFNIIHLPLMTIQPIEFEWKNQSDLINKFDAAIFISTNAVKYFYQKASLNKARLFAMGDNTAALVEQFSQQKVIFPENMNTEGFLALPELKSVEKQHWLIIKGQDGRSDLHHKLIEMGVKVTLLDVYQRQFPSQEMQDKMTPMFDKHSLWIITSAQALNNLQKIAEKNTKFCHSIQIIVSSDRLAKLAKDKDFKIIAQSRGASEQQLVECIQALATAI